MSEFEKELEAKIKSGEIMKERYKTGCIISHFVNLKDIESTFKYWQPPKPQKSLPVVPEDIDKAIKYLKTQNNFATITDLKKLDILTEKGFWWLNDFQFKDRRFGFGGLNNKLFILSHLAITGYTVEKEQLYVLKHIDLSEQYNNTSIYLANCKNTRIQHEICLNGTDVSEIEQCHFTQSEIDKLHIGSYEQIEVKVEEVEK